MPWLLAHEARVTWRELTEQISLPLVILLVMGLLLMLHAVFWSVLRPYADSLSPPYPAEMVFVAVAAMVAFFPLMVATAVNRSVVSLFDRGDLDLLVSSPLPGRVIFTTRTITVAAVVFVTAGVFVLPVGNVGVLLGAPQLLGVYPLLISLALVAASVGMFVTLWLVRLVGARRARTYAQVLGSIAGAALFLLLQVPNILGEGAQAALLARSAGLIEPFLPGGPLAADSFVWFPARALFFEPLPVLFVLALGAGLLWLSSTTLHRSFIAGTQEATTVMAPVKPRGNAASALRFRGSMAAVVLLKEWRGILRDPFLISQTLLQFLYLLPLGLVIFTGDGGLSGLFEQMDLLVLTAAAIVAGTLTSSVARIAFAGEEAADLLAAAPVPTGRLLFLKLLAAWLPVWLLTLPLALGLGFVYPRVALLALPLVLAVTVSVGLIRLMNPVRLKRADLFRNRNQGDTVMNVLEGLTPFAWGVSVLALGGALVGYAGLVAGIALPVLAWWRSRVIAP